MDSDRIITGIDIGTTKIVAVIANYSSSSLDNKSNIEILGIGEHPSEGLKGGVVVDIERTINSLEQAIKQAEEEAETEIDDVYVGITGDHIKCINYTGKVPISNSSQVSGVGSEITHKDIERVREASQAINMSPGRRILHTLSQSFEVDERKGIKKPIGLSGNTLSVKVHLVTSLINVEKDIETCFKKIGIRIADFVLEPLASSHSVLDQNEKDMGVVLIDIGGGTTDIVLYHDGGIQHSSAIPLAGHNITLDISKIFKTSFDQAQDIKHNYGLSKKELAEESEVIEIDGVRGRESNTISQLDLAEIIEPRITEILQLSNEKIKESGFKDKLNFGVVITGGGSQLKYIVDLAQEIFCMPVRIGFPELIDDNCDVYKDNPRYSTAIGMIQYAVENHKEQNSILDNDSSIPFLNFFKTKIKKLVKWY